ncbi:MAG: PIN domain-containing protein [Nanoarchaeota archaeon]
MDLVVDANILFASLIKESVNVELMLDENIRLFAPEYLLEEFYKNKAEILDKTHRTDEEFNDIFEILNKLITIVPAEEFSDFLTEAASILADHPKDVPYFALALKLRCPVWSNEKGLKNRKDFVVYSTHDVLQLVMSKSS